jgi:3-oxoacyl-[acyl-carrier-protein] synthase-3
MLAETQFRMDGRVAFRVASTHIEPFVTDLLADAGWGLNDIDLVIPHQASGRALDLMARRLGLDPARVMRTIEDGGNMIAASIPTALARALAQGRVRPGHKVMLIGTGAGISIAGACLVL